VNCLIVAAGAGGRLRQRGQSKPLILVHGVPLLERVISRAREAGVKRFFVVTGYRAEDVRAALDLLSARDGIPITHIHNDEWQRGNGVSVSKARPLLDGPFVLTMCDHLVDPAILRDLMASRLEPDTVTLAVDFNVTGSINDPEDVTRVLCSDGRIINIGKVIREFNAIDTGVFLCTPAMFDALQLSQDAGDDSISGAMKVLADQVKARVFDIQDRLWLDVDDPATLDKAEALLNSGRL
jgi:1L-myo-inositol 1-phosphate cytidylyltransferase